ncbi:MAG: RidA family protein [SAR324 cluster bacterium]|nr:RidA family protein [SAR324 cluster bacterium]
MNKNPVNSKNAPQAIGPYSQAVNSGGFLFISGQLPMNPKSNEIEVLDIKEQTRQIMENIGAILKECDLTFNDIVKTTIYLTDLGNFTIVNQEYGSFFKEYFPARATVEVSKLPKGSAIEIDAIALSKK